MAATEKITTSSSPTERYKVGDLWNSIDRLSKLLTIANWGIAATLFMAFVCTVIAIKAGNRKDELVTIEDGKKEERAINAESALSKLKESLTDRSISPAQKTALVAALSGKSQGPVEIVWLSGESDSYGLVLQIQEVFESAGWPKPVDRVAVGGTGEGLFIGVLDMSKPPAHAVAIQQAFASAGVTLTGFAKSDIPAGAAQIFIGQRPRVK